MECKTSRHWSQAFRICCQVYLAFGGVLNGFVNVLCKDSCDSCLLKSTQGRVMDYLEYNMMGSLFDVKVIDVLVFI